MDFAKIIIVIAIMFLFYYKKDRNKEKKSDMTMPQDITKKSTSTVRKGEAQVVSTILHPPKKHLTETMNHLENKDKPIIKDAPISVTPSNRNGNEIDLSSIEEVKKAIILSEIINRKY
jgi:hypothetical protein